MDDKEVKSYSRGLEDVIADESKICFIDGTKGKLFYRGYSIDELAQCTFPEVTYLLLNGELPNQEQLKKITTELRERRTLPTFVTDIISTLPKQAHSMEVLQTCVAALGTSTEGDDSYDHVLTLIAQFPLIPVYFFRLSQGQKIIPPKKDCSEGANFFYMLKGKDPTPEEARIFETCLILHMEHGFNASTFAARAIGSTKAPYHACIAGAIGSLYGPLHGGANEGVLTQIAEIGSPDRVREWVNQLFAKKEKIVGMGHRVYKVKDPRATILESMLESYSKKKGNTKAYEILKAVEIIMKEEMEKRKKPVYPNVDYFSGALYTLLGIDVSLYTSIFAIARIVGWSAHILELWKDNRIYRPDLNYTGPQPRSFVSLNNRK